MNYFINGEFEIKKNLSDINLVLLKISNSLFYLSKSQVCSNKLTIGGYYHKKYYKIINKGFFDNNNIVFNAKNMHLSEFLYNLKYNLCNYGIYFFKRNNKVYLKIYSGNSFLLDKNQLNYVEKTIKAKEYFFNKHIKILNIENLYEKNFFKTLKKLNLNIKCKNKHVNKFIKSYNLINKKSKIKIIIFKDLSYRAYYNNLQLNLKKVFNNFKFYDIIDDELIKKINLENIKRVVNKNFIIYNKEINYFDIFTTLKYLSWRFSNDKDYSKLV